jgi:hypothetical protein
MSNELERRKLSASEAGRKMDEALAKLGLAEQASRQPGRLGVSEIVEVPHVCAVFDKTYVAIYARRANELFRYQRSLRITDTEDLGAGGTHVRLEDINIDPNGPPECCAWCDAPPQEAYGKRLTTVKCGGCHAFVCLGKTKDNFFRCRPSCGCAGALSNTWVSPEGTKHRTPLLPSRPAAVRRRPQVCAPRARRSFPGRRSRYPVRNSCRPSIGRF